MGVSVSRSLAAGFSDPVFDSQSAFRRMMEALANPGRIRPIAMSMSADVPLLPSAAAVVLALCDFETPVGLSPHVAAMPGVAEFVRFHTGAPLVPELSRAAFAVVDLRHDDMDPASFAQGTAEYPDRSTTIIALCDSLETGAAHVIAGPGLDGTGALRVSPLPDSFAVRWAANRVSFPLGVDIIFAAPGQIVGLPRSTRIIGGAG